MQMSNNTPKDSSDAWGYFILALVIFIFVIYLLYDPGSNGSQDSEPQEEEKVEEEKKVEDEEDDEEDDEEANVKDEFIKSCSKAGADEKICKCVTNELTEYEMIQAVSTYQEDNVPTSEFRKAVLDCDEYYSY